jgi:hypothetical protein
LSPYALASSQFEGHDSIRDVPQCDLPGEEVQVTRTLLGVPYAGDCGRNNIHMEVLHTVEINRGRGELQYVDSIDAGLYWLRG